MKKFIKKIKLTLLKAKNIILRKKNFKISYSQCGEDIIMDFILGQFDLKITSYLEVGAYHPTKINNTYLFYKRGSSGVCVEPDPLLFDQFKKFRKRDKCLNIGIAEKETTNVDFYIMSSQTLNTFSLEEAKKFESYGSQKIEKVIKVDLKNINWVISNYFKTCPNLISIDVEGLDFEILRSLDLNKYRPEVICIETLSYTEDNTEEKEEEIFYFMKQAGYMLYADTYINSIFVEKDKWKSRKTK